jgi:hypothetical protein
MLQCSPQFAEMDRFARQVIAPYRQRQDAIAVAPAAISDGTVLW